MSASIWKRLIPLALLCAGGGSRGEDLLIIRLGEGENLASVAERHFGGADNGRELLAYNGFPEDAVLAPGTRLVIPMLSRQAALRQLSEAERALAVAQDEMADQYAPALFEGAAQAYRMAVDYRRGLDYARSAGMGRLCVLRSEDAVQAARNNANIRQTIALASIHGPVFLSGPGNTWMAAGTNNTVAVGQSLRTGGQGRAELRLPDGSRLRLMAESTVLIEELLLDRRTANRESRVRLLGGEIHARIPEAETPASTFTLHGPNAEFLLNGSESRVQVPQSDLTRLSVLAGAVRLPSRDRPLRVAAGHGTVIRGNRAPDRGLALLPPPALEGPELLQTPLQELDLSWKAVDHRDLGAYQWELAADADFLRPLERPAASLPPTAAPRAQTPILAEGDYFWRVASIHRDGLPGPWSGARRISVRKAMGVELVPESHVWNHEGQAYVAGGNRFALKATDTPSSVRDTEYRLNGGPFTRAPGFTLARSGVYEIEARGIAADGEAGPAITRQFVADVDAPTVRILREDAPAADGAEWVDIRIEAQDDTGVSRIQFRMNEGPWLQYLNPFRISRAQPVRVDVQAIDLFGNRSALERFDLKP